MDLWTRMHELNRRPKERGWTEIDGPYWSVPQYAAGPWRYHRARLIFEGVTRA